MELLLKILIGLLFLGLLVMNFYFRRKVTKSYRILVKNNVEFDSKHIFKCTVDEFSVEHHTIGLEGGADFHSTRKVIVSLVDERDLARGGHAKMVNLLPWASKNPFIEIPCCWK